MLEKLLRDFAQNIQSEIKTLKTDFIKRQTRIKWEIIDALDEIRYGNCQLSCRICDYTANINSFKKLISQCIFEGGKLERYECPRCGLIFGPLKFLYLDETSIANEYKTLYEVYTEGDTTDREIRTFLSLNPQKGAIYLNYGSGTWSNSIRLLREQGWNVFGYEPYVASNNDYTINNINTLSNMKFDGIFSNNLIEHIQYPLSFFQEIKNLLKDGSCRMAHATVCYDYAIEYTRFHVHFYTGKSINYLCDKVGLKITDITRDKSANYINYVYELNNP